MDVVLVGLSHKTAPVEIREELALDINRVPDFLRECLVQPSIIEVFALFTCNRVEILASTNNSSAAEDSIKNFLSSYQHIPLSEFEKYLYFHRRRDTVRHLFRVSSSLDSMMLGEPQILGQIKEAYAVAAKQKATQVILNRLIHRSFFVAKKVRTETNIASGAVSVSHAAVDLATKIFSDLDQHTALLIGAGEMAELALRHLIGHQIGNIMISNRTYERAIKTAELYDARPYPLDRLPELLIDADIVVTSTGSPRYLIDPPMVSEALKKRKQKPIFFIDIAVPRDVDPRIDDIDNVYRYDIDDLQAVVKINYEDRQQEVLKAEKIIDNEVTQFFRWLKTMEMTPTIVALKDKMEEVRINELQKTFGSLGHLNEEDKRSIEIMTQALLNKILHDPVTMLKEIHLNGDSPIYVEALRRLFRLDEELEEEDKESE
jgi:glutamyl-tRNA reductase